MKDKVIDDGRLAQICPYCSGTTITDSAQVAQFIQSYGCDDCRLGFDEVNDEFLKPDQVCRIYRMKRRTLYDQVQRRAIPFRRVGRKLLFSRAELERWSKSEYESK